MPISPNELPPRVTIAQPRRMAGPAIAALSMLSTVGIMGVLLGLGPWFGSDAIGSAASSSPRAAGGSSGSQFGPEADVALIALATRMAQTPEMTPGAPLAVYVLDAPTPTPVPTLPPDPIQLTVVAAWTPTPALPICPSERPCIWPTSTPTIVPTSTPFPRCVTPQPKKICDPHGTWLPPTATPTATAPERAR